MTQTVSKQATADATETTQVAFMGPGDPRGSQLSDVDRATEKEDIERLIQIANNAENAIDVRAYAVEFGLASLFRSMPEKVMPIALQFLFGKSAEMRYAAIVAMQSVNPMPKIGLLALYVSLERDNSQKAKSRIRRHFAEHPEHERHARAMASRLALEYINRYNYIDISEGAPGAKSESVSDEKRKKWADQFAKPMKDFAKQVAATSSSDLDRVGDLEALVYSFRQQLIPVVQPIIRDILQVNPPDTLEEKRIAASRINALLHSCGLAIQFSGQTGEAASVSVGTTASNANGWFRLLTRRRQEKSQAASLALSKEKPIELFVATSGHIERNTANAR